ncbi:hypothetical protein, partial [Anaerocolumna xylanovorans]|uniref:hypothetical protein n=1 Tax=Anaerocolumna xylanovorans TaxID=100134 RepID=UPI001A9A9653
ARTRTGAKTAAARARTGAKAATAYDTAAQFYTRITCQYRGSGSFPNRRADRSWQSMDLF